MIRSVDTQASRLPPIAVPDDGAVDSFNRMANHMLRSGFMLTSVMTLESVDERVRGRLADAIAELDSALGELRHTAISPFVLASVDVNVLAHGGIGDPSPSPLAVPIGSTAASCALDIPIGCVSQPHTSSCPPGRRDRRGGGAEHIDQ